MTQRIILFNGPPSSGKDTAAKHVMVYLGPSHFVVFDRMSRPIKRAFAALVGESIDRWDNVAVYEAKKDEHIDLLGVSYRQWQIDFSERFMKPLYGVNIFARLFVDRQKRQSKDAVILVPDCGFDVEYHTLCGAFGINNVLVVKLYRPGFDFTKDSRSYLKVGSFSDKRDTEQVIHITNSGTQAEFEAKVLQRVTRWLERSNP